MTDTQLPQTETQKGFFFDLTPDRVLEAVESTGLQCTGRCLTLNSFENRVYDVELETEEQSELKHLSANRRVVKFYRPGRWTQEQILEEHQFLADLNQAEIPAVAPLPFPDGQTLQQTKSGIWYTIFPKVGGRAPDELSNEQLMRIGRLLGRVHNVGAARKAEHRIRLDTATYGHANLNFLLQGNWIPLEHEKRYRAAVEKICQIAEPWLNATPFQRVHGDCHLGNLLWNNSGSFFLDFDDMVNGPVVQDLWLLLPGRDAEAIRQRDVLLEGYEEFRDFDRSSLKLIEALRALRIVHYTTWIAKRWDDPAFPLAFPKFNTHQYWSSEIDDLEEQLRLIS
jgi:Ser/Thr protein kinase RdoA (MazF antagonist)